MKIQLLRTVHSGPYYLRKGETHDVPAALAAQLIAEKSAQPAPETATGKAKAASK